MNGLATQSLTGDDKGEGGPRKEIVASPFIGGVLRRQSPDPESIDKSSNCDILSVTCG